jgi:hypothetical protein
MTSKLLRPLRQRSPRILSLWVLTLLLLGCQNPAAIGGDTPLSSPVTTPSPDLTLPMDDGISPEVLERVVQAAAQQAGVDPRELTVIGATAETWPDGCLGLGGPDELCTMALVDGWQVQVSHEETQWIYRTDRTGQLLRWVDPDHHSLLPPSVHTQLMAHITREIGIEGDRLTVNRATPAVWNGCLGVAGPEEACPELAIFGWRVEVGADTRPGLQFVYHTNHDGSDIRRFS